VNSIDLFYNFIREALEYHRVYNSEVMIQVFPGEIGAAIDLSKSNLKSVYLYYGEDTEPDYNLLIRLAWHEVAHLIDKVEGWPEISDQIENVIDEIMDHFPGKLAYGNCFNLLIGIENVISDISVIKRIIHTPARIPSLISMIKILQNGFDMKNSTKPERLRRMIAIAMEMQYIQTEKCDKYSKQMLKLEKRQLEKIYIRDQDFKKIFIKIQKIFNQVHSTKDENKKIKWIIDSCKLIPPNIVYKLSQEYNRTKYV